MIFNILVFILSFMFCLPLPVAFCPAQANCLSLGEINSSQLVFSQFLQITMVDLKYALWFLKLTHSEAQEQVIGTPYETIGNSASTLESLR
jgi:hypothetical protein